MEQALRQAAVSPADVQHINAHATSTPVGDKGKLAAIRSVFGSDSGVAISLTAYRNTRTLRDIVGQVTDARTPSQQSLPDFF